MYSKIKSICLQLQEWGEVGNLHLGAILQKPEAPKLQPPGDSVMDSEEQRMMV